MTKQIKVRVPAGGVGVPWLLTIVFLVLRFTGVISWSWWWVFAPLWIPAGVGVVLLILAGLAHVIGKAVDR